MNILSKVSLSTIRTRMHRVVRSFSSESTCCSGWDGCTISRWCGSGVTISSSWNGGVVSVFVVARLVTDGCGLGVVGVSDGTWSGVSWEGVGLLNVVVGDGFWLSLPELAAWGAGCVAVVWGWAKGFLFAVVAHECEFDEG
jgi:hypothetical protein